MIDPTKLQCLTTASWLRGYTDTLDDKLHPAISKMNQAADLLEKTWNEYAKENGYENTTA
jgi:hypothetical protein